MYCKYGVIKIYAVQIYAICTWLIAGRILVDVEIKLNFLLSKVKFGQHKKYQEWFPGTFYADQMLFMLTKFMLHKCSPLRWAFMKHNQSKHYMYMYV